VVQRVKLSVGKVPEKGKCGKSLFSKNRVPFARIQRAKNSAKKNAVSKGKKRGEGDQGGGKIENGFNRK